MRSNKNNKNKKGSDYKVVNILNFSDKGWLYQEQDLYQVGLNLKILKARLCVMLNSCSLSLQMNARAFTVIALLAGIVRIECNKTKRNLKKWDFIRQSNNIPQSQMKISDIVTLPLKPRETLEFPDNYIFAEVMKPQPNKISSWKTNWRKRDLETSDKVFKYLPFMTADSNPLLKNTNDKIKRNNVKLNGFPILPFSTLVRKPTGEKENLQNYLDLLYTILKLEAIMKSAKQHRQVEGYLPVNHHYSTQV